jgi:hypothetical protein
MVPEVASVGYARLASVAVAERRFDDARELVRAGISLCAESDGAAHLIRVAAAGVHAEAKRAQAAAVRDRGKLSGTVGKGPHPPSGLRAS